MKNKMIYAVSFLFISLFAVTASAGDTQSAKASNDQPQMTSTEKFKCRAKQAHASWNNDSCDKMDGMTVAKDAEELGKIAPAAGGDNTQK